MDLKSEQTQKTLIQEVIDSILTPGVNTRIYKIFNIIFGMLIATLLALYWMSSYSYHVLFLLIVAGCLWGTTTWFVGEIKKLEIDPKANHVKTD
jgi:uncharacterized membrane protein YccC